MSYPLRIGIIIFSIAVTSVTLHLFAQLISDLITINYNWSFELLAVSGMLLFQLPFIYKRSLVDKTRYYYQMLLVSLCGSLLIWPLLALSYRTHPGSIIAVSWFLGVVSWMFFNHRKWVRRLNMPAVLSYTWLVYRGLLLLLII